MTAIVVAGAVRPDDVGLVRAHGVWCWVVVFCERVSRGRAVVCQESGDAMVGRVGRRRVVVVRRQDASRNLSREPPLDVVSPVADNSSDGPPSRCSSPLATVIGCEGGPDHLIRQVQRANVVGPKERTQRVDDAAMK